MKQFLFLLLLVLVQASFFGATAQELDFVDGGDEPEAEERSFVRSLLTRRSLVSGHLERRQLKKKTVSKKTCAAMGGSCKSCQFTQYGKKSDTQDDKCDTGKKYQSKSSCDNAGGVWCPGLEDDCEGSWGGWGKCSTTCNKGKQHRTFTVKKAAGPYGDSCPAKKGATNTKDCNTKGCPEDCEGGWTSWGNCDASCWTGSGNKPEQERTYKITKYAKNGGDDCPYSHGKTEDKSCNTHRCPIDCEGSWSSWSSCDKTCGGGQSKRTFSISTYAQYGGATCSYNNNQVQNKDCNTKSCPVDCVGSWNGWGSCSKSCGGGKSHRTYSISTYAQHGGASCPYSHGEVTDKSCNTQKCPIDCIGSWQGWGSCSATCGFGTETRTFKVTRKAEYGGEDCSNDDGDVKSQTCKDQECPIHCEGGWTLWGSCDESCSGGERTRTYLVSVDPKYGGDDCPHDDGHLDIGQCNTHCCDVDQDGFCDEHEVDCEGHWEEWGDCSVTCGEGYSLRSYHVTQVSQNGGEECEYEDDELEKQFCEKDCCDADNDKICDEDDSCPDDPLNDQDNDGYCDGDEVDCDGAWSTWDVCSTTCGEGFTVRTYTIFTPASNGGDECPADDEELEKQECNTDPDDCCDSDNDGICDEDDSCPNDPLNDQDNDGYCDGDEIDCEGGWDAWTDCSTTCDAGVEYRTYSIFVPAQNGGEECTYDDGKIEKQECNTDVDDCCDADDDDICDSEDSCLNDPVNDPDGNGICENDEVDCIGDWNSWTGCSTECGPGQDRRTFVVTQAPTSGGVQCAYPDGTVESLDCNTEDENCCDLDEDDICDPEDSCLDDASNDADSDNFCDGDEVDCYGIWTLWGDCSASCDTGSRERTFKVIVPASNGGDECPAEDEEVGTQPCNTECCDYDFDLICDEDDTCPNDGENDADSDGFCDGEEIDCVGGWAGWGVCDVTCGSGNIPRTYLISTPASAGGEACPYPAGYVDLQPCDLDCCDDDNDGVCDDVDSCPDDPDNDQNNDGVCDGDPVDCEGGWAGWASCPVTCGVGLIRQTYVINVPAINGGEECPHDDGDIMVDYCTLPCCDNDDDGICDDEDSCPDDPANDQDDDQICDSSDSCPDDPTNDQNNDGICDEDPVDCVGSWQGWSDCPATCGGSTFVQTFIVTVPAANGGEECEADHLETLTTICDLFCCDEDEDGICDFEDSCVSDPLNDADEDGICDSADSCPKDAENDQDNDGYCDGSTVDCVGSWQGWASCPVTCGIGMITQTYIITTPASNGGDECPFDHEEVMVDYCTLPCCDVDADGICDDSDTCLTDPLNDPDNDGICDGVDSCPDDALNDQDDDGICDGVDSCPNDPDNDQNNDGYCDGGAVDCVGGWAGWATCDVTCGEGELVRTYFITTPASNGGVDCPYNHMETLAEDCVLPCCDDDDDNICDEVDSCPNDSQNDQDNDGYCDGTSCEAYWTEWSDCTNGAATTTRTYVVVVPGEDCESADDTVQEKACTTTSTTTTTSGPNQDCEGEWSEWSTCSAGTHWRHFDITVPQGGNGEPCDHADEEYEIAPCVLPCDL